VIGVPEDEDVQDHFC
jgi:hypothetical protein